MNNDEATRAAMAHAAYLAQTRQLVDAQTEALFGLVTAVLARARADELAARHADVSRQDHTLTVTNGPCSEVFAVEAISDLPDGANHALLFPTSQARCLIRTSEGRTIEWLLRRDNAGNSTQAYAWMLAGSDTHLGESEMNGVLRPLLACELPGRGTSRTPAAPAAR